MKIVKVKKLKVRISQRRTTPGHLQATRRKSYLTLGANQIRRIRVAEQKLVVPGKNTVIVQEVRSLL